MDSFKSRLEPCITPDALIAYLAECISTFIFVFASAGSTMSTRKMMPDAPLEPNSLAAIVIANAFGMAVAVYIASNVSGGHVNPAVTFGIVVGGYITTHVSIFYSISQILGSVMACLVLKINTVSQKVPTSEIPNDMTGFGVAIIEGVMTFALVYAIYATSNDSRHGGPLEEGVGSLAIGFIIGANVLASGPFTGGSGLVAIFYDNVVRPNQEPDAELDDIVGV